MDDEPIKQFKTFYHTPKKTEQIKYYTTMRGFSFRTERAV